MALILASASPRRKDLLTQIGITDFTVKPSDIDETLIKDESARMYALRMAVSKADAVTNFKDSDLIISADTVVSTARQILPKVEDEKTARMCIEKLSGKRHNVYGGICLRTNDHTHTAVIKTVVQFKNLSKNNIDLYISSGDWNGKAGGYAIQGLASRYISFISGSYTNVVGLDVHTLYKWLQHYGY